MANFKLAPPGLKAIQPYLKIAEEHEKRDPSITYWCRFYAVQNGLKINDKSPENTNFFIKLMDWLENEKKSRREDETISNEVVAQAHIENYALKLFLWADNEDRAGRFNKNVVKAFYTAGFIYDVVNTFGEPSEEVLHHRKYAKWKSTYIHNCLKNGETPIPGPMAMEGAEDEEDELTRLLSVSGNQPANNPPPPSQAPYPTGGLFNMSTSQPEAFNLPVPGAHAPPSTPNGTNQLSPSTSIANICPEQENKGGVRLTPEDFHKAQKYCKFAGSALTYEDAPTAIENLQKALRLLTTGQDS
ncbi:vacuolar protein sorting-associated protein VTA1 homolog [Argiope bruennichi]|uniref:Vacuolar protein sorting-associated protein like n=1 Tax=Argiope bruennichi TaxID=94029 RepID=A0A8T0FC75_ARGBR|nr:vacuolar protein sorting-associated protein VTA1 homolog [Argiope bruennichi]KAF8787029.1 Vacuolar protein sorting-associated protein like [Argiope bruennichi]